MSEIKLKSFPFCGGVARMARIASEGETVVFVTCRTCHVETPVISVSAEYCANEKAAGEWNSRADVPPRANWTREDFTSYDGETIKNGAAICGRCKKAFFMPTDTFDYCPNCGARMDEEAQP